MSISAGCRCGLEPVLLWLWCRPAAAALIRPLAWEAQYATDVALKSKKIFLKLKKNKSKAFIENQNHL